MTGRERVKCFHCQFVAEFVTDDGRNGHVSVESAARVAGWRRWPSDDEAVQMLCPRCAGTATAEQVQQIAGWDAECETCGLTMSEDYDDEPGPFTREDALRWQSSHDCEPDVSIIPPKSALTVGRAS